MFHQEPMHNQFNIKYEYFSNFKVTINIYTFVNSCHHLWIPSFENSTACPLNQFVTCHNFSSASRPKIPLVSEKDENLMVLSQGCRMDYPVLPHEICPLASVFVPQCIVILNWHSSRLWLVANSTFLVRYTLTDLKKLVF